MMRLSNPAWLFGASALLIAGCSPSAPQAKSEDAAPPAPKAAPAPAPVSQPAPPLQEPAAPAPQAAVNSPVAQAIDQATWSASAPAQPGKAPVRNDLIRVQVLLDRAHFSPGVIDGQDGGNMKNAIAAFEAARKLPVDGMLDDKVWSELAKDTGPVVTNYVITDAEANGPYLAEIPKDYTEMAKLDKLSYTSPVEALAEKFHMDEALLRSLNPGVDFAKAGTTILVAAVSPDKLPAAVTRVEVDKTKKQVRAYDQGGVLLAAYPATIGSTDMPTPEGKWAVRTIAPNPTYTYDPTRLTYGDKSQGKLTIKAGPNNPVGAVWIDLTKDTYGIHGAPDPRLVGKTASHGCVRLTNWDVTQLSKSVSKGTVVEFVGA
jgi:lipoprotein-anchoring transpeptidase ErfK/SrfK